MNNKMKKYVISLGTVAMVAVPVVTVVSCGSEGQWGSQETSFTSNGVTIEYSGQDVKSVSVDASQMNPVPTSLTEVLAAITDAVDALAATGVVVNPPASIEALARMTTITNNDALATDLENYLAQLIQQEVDAEQALVDAIADGTAIAANFDAEFDDVNGVQTAIVTNANKAAIGLDYDFKPGFTYTAVTYDAVHTAGDQASITITVSKVVGSTTYVGNPIPDAISVDIVALPVQADVDQALADLTIGTPTAIDTEVVNGVMNQALATKLGFGTLDTRFVYTISGVVVTDGSDTAHHDTADFSVTVTNANPALTTTVRNFTNVQLASFGTAAVADPLSGAKTELTDEQTRINALTNNIHIREGNATKITNQTLEQVLDRSLVTDYVPPVISGAGVITTPATPMVNSALVWTFTDTEKWGFDTSKFVYTITTSSDMAYDTSSPTAVPTGITITIDVQTKDTALLAEMAGGGWTKPVATPISPIIDSAPSPQEGEGIIKPILASINSDTPNPLFTAGTLATNTSTNRSAIIIKTSEYSQIALANGAATVADITAATGVIPGTNPDLGGAAFGAKGIGGNGSPRFMQTQDWFIDAFHLGSVIDRSVWNILIGGDTTTQGFAFTGDAILSHAGGSAWAMGALSPELGTTAGYDDTTHTFTGTAYQLNLRIISKLDNSVDFTSSIKFIYIDDNN